MTIKNFVKAYNEIATESLKEKYIKENIEVIAYVPFIKKNSLAENLVNISTYKYEDYKKDDGNIGRRKTGIINVNSTVQYLLFCRLIIENYTNLKVETDGFFEEYDMLKQSGLLEILMMGTEIRPSLIPASEISEFRAIVDMKQKDAMANYATPQSYISNQVERFGTLLGVTLKPVLDKINTSLENMDEKDIEKLGSKLEKVLKRVK